MENVPLELSVTHGDKEAKSNLEVSNLYLRQQLQGFCRDEGLGMDSSIEHLGINRRTSSGRLGCKRPFRCFKDRTSGRALKKLINVGLVPARIWWDKASGICPTQRTRIRRKGMEASFHIDLEMAKRRDERAEDEKTLRKVRVEVVRATRREEQRRATWKRKKGVVKTLTVLQRQYTRTGTKTSLTWD